MIDVEDPPCAAATPRTEVKPVLDFGQGSREQSQPVRPTGRSNVHSIARKPIEA
jgi:hypothetical protein